MEHTTIKRKWQLTLAAFVITFIFFGAMWGFIMVDINSEKYMPGQFGPMFQITELDGEGVEIALWGTRYRIDADTLEPARDFVLEHPYLVPRHIRMAGALTARGYLAAEKYLEEQNQPEPWD